MWRANSLEKTLMLGKIEGRRRRGWQRIRLLTDIIDSEDMSLSKLLQGREAWRSTVPGVTKSRTWLNNSVSLSCVTVRTVNPLGNRLKAGGAHSVEIMLRLYELEVRGQDASFNEEGYQGLRRPLLKTFDGQRIQAEGSICNGDWISGLRLGRAWDWYRYSQLLPGVRDGAVFITDGPPSLFTGDRSVAARVCLSSPQSLGDLRDRAEIKSKQNDSLIIWCMNPNTSLGY